MKEVFEPAELEIIPLSSQDIITQSDETEILS